MPLKKILLAERRPLFILCICDLIKKQFDDIDIDIVDSVQTSNEKLATVNYHMVVMGLPIENWVGFLRKELKLYTATKTLIISSEPSLLPATDLYNAGILGIIENNISINEFVLALQNIYNGQVYSHVQLLAPKHTSATSNDADYLNVLTQREKTVVSLLLKGQTTGNISNILSLSPSSVSILKRQIFNKMKVENIVELFWAFHNVKDKGVSLSDINISKQ